MATTVTVVVSGRPAPQGSKIPVIAANGKAILIEAGDKAARQRHTTWRKEVANAGKAAMEAAGLTAPLSGPIAVKITYRVPIAKSRAADAPVWHARSPDIDKLTRATFDGLSKIVYVDDRLIAQAFLAAIETTRNHGATITVTELNESPRVKANS
jgi:Holliday junction resolvase RusA-like endonuclease